MPELPEVEITVRRIERALAGAVVEAAAAPGIATLKTFDPPLDELAGRPLSNVRRLGKMLVFELADLALLVHLMGAGRIRVLDEFGSSKDKAARLVLRLRDGRELRLREAGTRQRAWAKLLPAGAVEDDPAVRTLGPDAWPAPPADRFRELIAQPRHLHPLLRDQRTIAGIGRSWVDEILWEAELSPFRQGSDLEDESYERLRDACDTVLGGAIEHYERNVGEVLPDKLPMPLRVHRREGEACPRCGTKLEAVYFKDNVMSYCPAEQTGGRLLKDRRLSRLIK